MAPGVPSIRYVSLGRAAVMARLEVAKPECRVVGYDDGDVDGGQEDAEVPRRLWQAPVAQHQPRALGYHRLVLGQGLYLGRWRAQQ